MKHISVLLNESIEALNIVPEGIYVDATLGGGGHSLEILKKLNNGHLYAFDQDKFAHEKASERLKNYHNKTLIHSNFSSMEAKLNQLNITQVDGILFDLGLSSFQIDDASRGFSYLKDNELDMRMNKEEPLTAKDIINTYDRQALTDIFRNYGDEKNAWVMAGRIIEKRPINTTLELVSITDSINKNQKGHSAKRVFQALRIEVNRELEVLKSALEQSIRILKPGGRLVIITFQSLEDRIVKQFFKQNSELNLPKHVDVRFVQQPPLKIIQKKAIKPSLEELNENKRSHSAQLRIAEKQ